MDEDIDSLEQKRRWLLAQLEEDSSEGEVPDDAPPQEPSPKRSRQELSPPPPPPPSDLLPLPPPPPLLQQPSGCPVMNVQDFNGFDMVPSTSVGPEVTSSLEEDDDDDACSTVSSSSSSSSSSVTSSTSSSTSSSSTSSVESQEDSVVPTPTSPGEPIEEEEVEPVENLLEAAEEDIDQNKIWKIVLESIENDHFDSLPEGWCRVTHSCGLPVYLHRASRVCTMSRPYFIGTDSVRKHSIPLTAIPCLHQKKINARKEQEEAQKVTEQEKQVDEFGSQLLEKIPAPVITIERSEDYKISPPEMTDYASKVFKFKKIQVAKFSNFKEKKLMRIDAKIDSSLKESGLTQEDMKKHEGESIVTPSGIALISIPTADNRFHRKSFVMNPSGRSSLMILHEYVQRALKGRIVYDIDDAKNSAYNVRAVLYIKKKIRVQVAPTVKEKLALLQESQRAKVPYLVDSAKEDEDTIVMGHGTGTSKKAGKMVAAEMALKILMPDLKFNDQHIASISANDTDDQSYDSKAIQLFDNLAIDDPRVSEMCVKTGQAKPMVVLKEACNRSMKLHGKEPVIKNRMVDNQRSEVTITVGDYECSVVSLGAKSGKQKAAQGILKQLHPELSNFGSILRLYASAEEKSDRRMAQKNHNEVVRLQNKGARSGPNHAVLEKLREEMRKLAAAQYVRPAISTTYPMLPMEPVYANQPPN